MRKKALTEITSFMNQFEKVKNAFIEDDVRTQFKNLKDMYQRKVKRMKQMKNQSQKVEEPCWFYFQHLKFLDTVYRQSQSISRSPSPLDIVKSEIPSAMDEPIPTTETLEKLPSVTSKRRRPPPPPPLSIKRTRASTIITETAPSPPLSSTPIIPARKNEDSDDELSIFGVFVGRSLRKLASSSPALAIQVKKQINDLLCEAELNELGYKNSPTT
uniref:MADF domain-containing protein n=1 Tax=Panagrolaimus davidi TaxID=227884 RepID=A0A914PT03_9BILA